MKRRLALSEGGSKKASPQIDVRRLLSFMGDERICNHRFDEFDRLRLQRVRAAMADTMKILSDHDVQATVILGCVSLNQVSQLIA
jgi:hypothetical protein